MKWNAFIFLAFLLDLSLSPITVFSQNMPFTWSKVLGNDGNNLAKHILCDNNGCIYVSGEFKEAFTIDGIPISGPATNNIFLIKLESDGGLIWSSTFGCDMQINLGGMVFDLENNIILDGTFSGSLLLSYTSLLSGGGSDIFLLKFNEGGDLILAVSNGGVGNESATALAFSQANELYIGGSIMGACSFGTVNLLSDGEWIWTPWGSEWVYIENAFYARYNDNLECTFARQLSADFSKVYSLAADLSGNIYISGYFSGTDELIDTTTADQGNFLIFKYNPTGELTGFIQEGSGNNYIKGNALVTDQEGNLYAGGYIGCTGCIFGDSLMPESYNDAFLVKYDPQGEMQWINLIGQYHGDSDGNENSAHALTLDNNGNVYMTGYYDGIVWDGLEIISHNSILDLLVVKADPQGVIQSIGTFGYPSWDSGEGIALNPSGKILLAGMTYMDHFSSDQASYIFIAEVDSILPVSIKERYMAERIKLYPNPTAGKVILELPDGMGIPMEISIISLDGKTIDQTFSCQNPCEIDLSQVKPGLYYLQVSFQHEFYVKKLIKIRAQ